MPWERMDASAAASVRQMWPNTIGSAGQPHSRPGEANPSTWPQVMQYTSPVALTDLAGCLQVTVTPTRDGAAADRGGQAAGSARPAAASRVAAP